MYFFQRYHVINSMRPSEYMVKSNALTMGNNEENSGEKGSVDSGVGVGEKKTNKQFRIKLNSGKKTKKDHVVVKHGDSSKRNLNERMSKTSTMEEGVDDEPTTVTTTTTTTSKSQPTTATSATTTTTTVSSNSSDEDGDDESDAKEEIETSSSSSSPVKPMSVDAVATTTTTAKRTSTNRVVAVDDLDIDLFSPNSTTNTANTDDKKSPTRTTTTTSGFSESGAESDSGRRANTEMLNSDDDSESGRKFKPTKGPNLRTIVFDDDSKKVTTIRNTHFANSSKKKYFKSFT